MAAPQASLSFTISQGLLKLRPIRSMMPSNHLILCHPLLLLPSVFPSTTDFSNESFLCIRWPEYCSFSFSIIPSNEYSGLIYKLLGPKEMLGEWQKYIERKVVGHIKTMRLMTYIFSKSSDLAKPKLLNL